MASSIFIYPKLVLFIETKPYGPVFFLDFVRIRWKKCTFAHSEDTEHNH